MRSERQSGSPPLTNDGGPQEADCQWRAPRTGQKVVLPPELILELRQTAIQAFLAIPRRGVEVGGLLLGAARREPVRSNAPETAVFQITEAEDVTCEHSFGPSYVLSEMDQRRFSESLAGARRVSAGVIGLYRSYTGRDAGLDEADQDLLRTFFPKGDFVCLLLQPLSVEKCLACFRFWRNGRLLSEPACEPFTFDASHMEEATCDPPAKATPDVTEPAEAEQSAAFGPSAPVSNIAAASAFGPAAPVSNVASASQGAFAAQVPWHHRYREEEEARGPGASLLRVLPAVLICILFAIAFAAVYQLWAQKREPRWEALRFDARLDAGEMRLSWDPAVPAVAQAARGVLLVNDGRNPKTIQLSAEQLRRGNLSYSPASGDLRFQLRLSGDGMSVVTDTLRVITTAHPATPGAVEPPPAAPGPQPAPVPTPVPAVRSSAARREVQPEIPAGIRRRILSPRVVSVTVDIDEAGHVTRAFSKGAGNGIDRYLAEAAVRAARQWSFTPARSKDGSSVAATKTLSFEFTPPGK